VRHSLSNWLVNKAKIEPKTVQGILRHAKIQTTLDLYTQEDSGETTRGAGGISDGARSQYEYGAVTCGLDCGLRFLGQHPVTYWKQMVGLGGLEPPTSPLSVLRSLVACLEIQDL
jgi:hypothetical protein